MKYNSYNNSASYGSSIDVRMSLIDYGDFLAALATSPLSDPNVVRMKHLSEVNNSRSVLYALMGIPPAYLAMRLLTYPVNLMHANYKINVVGFMFTYPIVVIGLCFLPMRRRLYTELLTDKGADGTYIRSSLREKKPHLWNYLEKQLKKAGFKYEEMNDEHSREFPSALLE